MKKIISSFLIAFAPAIASFAFADQIALNQYSGNYVEINAGTNLYYWGIVSSQGSGSSAGVKGMGWNVALGHYITPRFGLEAGFMQNYAEATFNNHTNSHLNVPYATTRFNVPMGDRFSFIGKIGLGYAFSGGNGILLPYTGVGFSYAVNQNVDITTQYQGLVLGIVGAGLLSLGITYHF
jgi:hypothetical protein